MRPFAWSWSRLKNYRTCPKRHWHLDLAKDIREEEGEALKWGHEVHEAMALRISKGKELPEVMQRYEAWPARIAGLASNSVEVLVENKMAMDKDFRASSFFDNGTWFRGVVDAMAINHADKVATAFDWKTGKVEPDFEQLGLFAQLIFAKYPEIDTVGAIYVWLGHDTHTLKTYRRDEMIDLWNGLWPEIKVLEEAHRTTTYPPKPSGLCKRYCPVETCPYHGRGTT